MTDKDIQSLKENNYGKEDILQSLAHSENDFIVADIAKRETYLRMFDMRLFEIINNHAWTLLLTQMIYWFEKNNRQPFYKFYEPCSHPQYKNGDSWLEEVGATKKQIMEFLRKFGFKQGKQPKGQIPKSEEEALIIYWKTQNNLTYYSLNYRLITEKLLEIMRRGYFAKLQNVTSGSYKMSLRTITKTTPKKTHTYTKFEIGEVSPNPSLTEPEPLTEERLAYLNQLAYKKDLKTLGRLLTKAIGAERDYIKNLISYLKGKTSTLPEPPTVLSSPPQQPSSPPSPNLELTEDQIKTIMIEMGFKREFILKQFKMFKIWVEENDVKVKNAYNRFIMSFLSKYDVFRHPENVYSSDLTYPFRVYYTSIKEAGVPELEAKKTYYFHLFDTKLITAREYFDRCRTDGLLTAYDLYRSIQRGYLSVEEALEIEPFYWESEPRADELTAFYGGEDRKKEFYQNKEYINKIKELAQ